MRIDVPIAIAGAAVWSPPAVGAGENAFAPDASSGPAATGSGSSAGPTGPEMAAQAAVDARAEAGCAPSEVDGLAYGWASHQGEHVWTPPHRVARLLGANRCVALGVRQMANSGAAALREAVTWLLTEPDWTTTVAATGDDFRTTTHDRCRTRLPPGAGATAIVLARGSGRRTVTSVVLAPLMTLDEEQEGSASSPQVVRACQAAVRLAVAQALDEMPLTAQDRGLSAVLVPGAQGSPPSGMVTSALPEHLQDRVRPTGASTGGRGAGDLLAGLAEHPPPDPGDHHLLVGVAPGVGVAAVVVSGH